MWRNGKDMNLEEYVEEQHKFYIGKPAYLWDEGIVWAIQEYYGSMGEFNNEDWDYIHEMDMEEIAFMCEEEY